MNEARPFGIYIHWPFCHYICPYCDFNVYRLRGQNTRALIDDLKREISFYAKTLGQRPLVSLYFGGGTPSLLAVNEIEELILHCEKSFGFAQNIEISLEANPEEYDKFAGFMKSGINRLSLGVQSFDALGLKALGRLHDVKTSFLALEAAQKSFENFSVDLIYGWSGQDENNLTKDLQIIFQSNAKHLSPYHLTIEENTAFAKKFARGALKVACQETSARFFEMISEIGQQNGFAHYEISNHAKEGYFSRHNLLYWKSNDWLGIGAGAHARLEIEGKRHAISNPRDLGEYSAKIASFGNDFIGFESDILSEEEYFQEYYLMGLRLENGIELSNKFRLPNMEKIKELQGIGMVDLFGNILRITKTGRALSDEIIAQILG